MNSTKLFNRLRDYLKQMCDSVDEIKGNLMTRYSSRALKRDNFVKKYDLDYREEIFIDDFFINIFCVYVNEMAKILNKNGFFKKFYKKYIANSIKLANSRDFLNHSSLDAIMLPIEAALFRFFNYGKSIECRKLRNKIVRKIRKKINRIEISCSCFDFGKETFETHMKFKDLFNKKTYPSLSNLHRQMTELNEFLDYIFEEMFFKTSFAIVLVEFIKKALKEGSKLIKDTNFNQLKEDMYLYFVRNTGSYITVYDLLSNSYNKIRDFIKSFSDVKKKYDNISETTEEESKTSFVESVSDIIKNSDIISILETLHEFCYRNYKIVMLSSDEAKNISDEILLILNKLKKINIDDYNVLCSSLVHLSLNVDCMWKKIKEIIQTKKSFELSELFNEYIENSINNNESRLFSNPVFRKYIKGGNIVK